MAADGDDRLASVVRRPAAGLPALLGLAFPGVALLVLVFTLSFRRPGRLPPGDRVLPPGDVEDTCCSEPAATDRGVMGIGPIVSRRGDGICASRVEILGVRGAFVLMLMPACRGLSAALSSGDSGARAEASGERNVAMGLRMFPVGDPGATGGTAAHG